MSRRGYGAWIGALATALFGTACARGDAPEGITTVRSAVTTNVVVTVRDAAGTLLPNIEVYALNNAGSAQYSV